MHNIQLSLKHIICQHLSAFNSYLLVPMILQRNATSFSLQIIHDAKEYKLYIYRKKVIMS